VAQKYQRGGNLRIAVLGAGLMGKGAAFDLVSSPQVEDVLIVDSERGRAESLAEWLKSPKAKPVTADAQNPEEIVGLLESCDAAISCLPYRFNLEVVKYAIRAQTNLCDLGGNIEIVKKELALPGGRKGWDYHNPRLWPGPRDGEHLCSLRDGEA